jgi:hypothetical protein
MRAIHKTRLVRAVRHNISIKSFPQYSIGISQGSVVGQSVDENLGSSFLEEEPCRAQHPQVLVSALGSLSVQSQTPEPPNKRCCLGNPEDQELEPNAVASNSEKPLLQRSLNSPSQEEDLHVTNRNEEGFGDDSRRNEYDVRTTLNIPHATPVSNILHRMTNMTQISEALKTIINLPCPLRII